MISDFHVKIFLTISEPVTIWFFVPENLLTGNALSQNLWGLKIIGIIA